MPPTYRRQSLFCPKSQNPDDMATPATGDINQPTQHSDSHLILYSSNSRDNNVIITHPSPTPNPPRKRRITKSVTFGGTTTILDNLHSCPQMNTVVQDLSSKSSKKKKSATKRVKCPVEKTPALIRAEEVQSSLGTEKPSCVKLIVKAHVDPGYWMGFPKSFSELYLPKKDDSVNDCEMLIEDENIVIHRIKYSFNKSGLSAGWKKFAAGHNLQEGDALVFHLVEDTKLKVYIIRANNLQEVNGALCLLNVENQMIPEQSGDDSEEVGPEVLVGSRTSITKILPEKRQSLEDFHITVNGKCIDSELSDDVRMEYHKLCTERKESIHDDLPKGLSTGFVAEMIGAVATIANKIRNSKTTTAQEDFEKWDHELKIYSLIGMKVIFLRERIVKLSRAFFESEDRVDMEKYVEAENEQKRAEDKKVNRNVCGSKGVF